jgi:hypothetical protein
MHPNEYQRQREASLYGRKLRTPETSRYLGVSHGQGHAARHRLIVEQGRFAMAEKSDSGARNGQIRVKSGATEVGGADTALSTSYGWLTRVDTVDPNTGAPWTAAAVNALQVGPKVTA